VKTTGNLQKLFENIDQDKEYMSLGRLTQLALPPVADDQVSGFEFKEVLRTVTSLRQMRVDGN
jgi:hypothetical protein